MANHKSAVKAHKKNAQRREGNRHERTRLRSALKSIRATLGSGDAAAAKSELQRTVSLIDKMSGKGIIHDNTAGRYKSRLTRQLAKLSASA